ncbi:glycosylphosphatidylinositol anchor biosynthesis [Cryptotrichosporon argae]
MAIHVPPLLFIPLILRALHLLLPQTAFQPDEFYQSLEPAHRLVFGAGHETWEWRDLPAAAVDDAFAAWLRSRAPGWAGAWDAVVVRGRMRGWIWPGVFAGVYRVLQLLELSNTDALVLAPRVVGVLVAALTDYYTARLAARVVGPGAAATALFLSLTSFFHAHALPRALSTSPETLLTTAALVYFPLASLNARPRRTGTGTAVAGEGASARTKEAAPDEKPAGAGAAPSREPARAGAKRLDHVAMDRVEDASRGVAWRGDESAATSVALSTVLATTALCIRPTMAVFWAYLHVERTVSLARRSPGSAVTYVARVLLYGLFVVAASTALDYALTGRLAVPALTFLHRNLVLNISSFYGATSPLYHLTQTLPILMFPLYLPFAHGYAAALLPAARTRLDTPPPLRQLVRAATVGVLALSLSPHSEWRFLHALLPVLLLAALPALFAAYEPRGPMLGSIPHTLRQYLRLSPRAFYGLLLAPAVPFIYLNIWHGAAQVGVANALRRGDVGTVRGLVVLAACHSTPWASHLGATVTADGDGDGDGDVSWFLKCEPPLAAAAGAEAGEHWTQDDLFYARPVDYMATVFPYPPMPLGETTTSGARPQWPTHVVLFGHALDLAQSVGTDSDAYAMGAGTGGEETGTKTVSVRDVLRYRGYEERWAMWNGFDVLQDDERKRGGVRVWVREAGGAAQTSW